MTADLIISSVDGWASGTRLYRLGDDYWLICVIDVGAVRDAVAAQWGIDLPPDDTLTGHAEIYRATCEVTEVLGWIADTDTDIVAIAADTTGVTAEQTDTTITWMRDGARIGGMHKDVERVDYVVTAIDADGDPLNGLTPQWVLPHGTTFEQALDHIQTQTQEVT